VQSKGRRDPESFKFVSHSTIERVGEIHRAGFGEFHRRVFLGIFTDSILLSFLP
jgi:hypothetical protein